MRRSWLCKVVCMCVCVWCEGRVCYVGSENCMFKDFEVFKSWKCLMIRDKIYVVGVEVER